MSHQFSYGRTQNVTSKGADTRALPGERSGENTGRIVKLRVGQGYGLIRLAKKREIYFHRADLQEGTSINEFELGDAVVFELFEDHVSGARALRVRRVKQARR
jgi:hypothetical protein